LKKLGLLLLMLVVVGCANQPKPSDPPPPPLKQESAPSSDFVLGGISLGDTEEIVVKALGQPDEESVLHGIGIPLWIYKRQGLQVAILVTQVPL
jgi:hypothetical protein